MKPVGRVTELWRYPVKSLAGERLERARLGAAGILGDRGWALRDEQTGRIVSAKRVAELLDAHAISRPGAPAIALPDGRAFSVEVPEAAELLSEWLGRAIRAVRAPGGTARAEIESDGDDSFRGKAGGFFDSTSVHLLTSSTLEYLGTLYPAGVFDPRRFRPNIVIECGEAGPVEQGWVGRTLALGAATVEVIKPCGRCVVTTAPQPGLPHDRGILQTVARHQDNHVGVKCEVRALGEVSVGDEVALLD